MEIFLPLMMIIEDGDDFDEDDADVDALVITRLSSFISVLLQLHGRQLHGHFQLGDDGCSDDGCSDVFGEQ